MLIQYKLIAIGILLIVTNMYSYFSGKQVVTKEYNEYRVAVESASVKLQAENSALRLRQVAETDKINKEHNNAIDTIRKSYQSRLNGLQRTANRCDRTLSGNPETPRLTDEATPNTGPSANSFEAVCQQLETECSVTTLNHIYLQDWVTNVCQRTTSH